jgi:transposase InsO family protein
VRPGTPSEENAKIRRLEQENRELRRANEILRSASAFFAAELEGLVVHSDAGSQGELKWLSQRLAELGAVPSIGSVGDSHDNLHRYLGDVPPAESKPPSTLPTSSRSG